MVTKCIVLTFPTGDVVFRRIFVVLYTIEAGKEGRRREEDRN